MIFINQCDRLILGALEFDSWSQRIASSVTADHYQRTFRRFAVFLSYNITPNTFYTTCVYDLTSAKYTQERTTNQRVRLANSDNTVGQC